MLWGWLESPEDSKKRRKHELEYLTNLMKREKREWDPKAKFEKILCIDGVSYQKWLTERMLFPDLPLQLFKDKQTAKNTCKSPDGEFIYANRKFPKLTKCETAFVGRRGAAYFSTDVVIPILLKAHPKPWEDEGVWMSLTPMEVFTCRGGIRAAKKHTVVAGLGMGYQLVEISRKKAVKKVTVVEINQGLVEWLIPIILPKLGKVELEVVVGDAKKLVPEMTADVAIADIFDSYGGNEFPACPNIGRVWIWGTQFCKQSCWD